MESLYVCHFSNGHIKVGRSIDPASRIASHADRVACVGVELMESAVFECVGSAVARESALIARCIEVAEARHQNEWFVGLAFANVCAWADAIATSYDACTTFTRWSRLIAELVSAGVTQAQIAEQCKSSTSAISRLAKGQQADPLHSLGERIIALHRERIAA
jgi:hypothetical protein